MNIECGRHLGAAREWLQWNTNIENEGEWYWGSSEKTVTLTLEQIDALATEIKNKLEQKEK